MLNMNMTVRAAQSARRCSSTSTSDPRTVTSTRSHGVVVSNSAATRTAACAPVVVTIA